MKQINVIVLAAAMFFGCYFSLSVSAQEKAGYEVEYLSPQSGKDFRFSIGGGYAFRLGKVQKTGDAGIDDLNKQLRHGYTVDADAQYFFKESWGVGLNANFCSSSCSGDHISISGFGAVGNYKESQNILFIGPSFATRNESERFLLTSSLALGPVFYMDKMTIDGRVLDASKTTVGFNAGIGGEYKLNAKTGIGMKLSYTLASINSLNVQGKQIQSDETISISNLMISVFFSFRSW